MSTGWSDQIREQFGCKAANPSAEVTLTSTQASSSSFKRGRIFPILFKAALTVLTFVFPEV